MKYCMTATPTTSIVAEVLIFHRYPRSYPIVRYRAVVSDGGKVMPRRRRCDASLVEDLWQNRDGKAIHARLIAKARLIFIQYFDIPPEHYQVSSMLRQRLP